MNGHHKQAAPTELGVLKRGIHKHVAPAGAEKFVGPRIACTTVPEIPVSLGQQLSWSPHWVLP